MKTKDTKTRDKETEILDLAEAVGIVFWEPGATGPINRLIKTSRDYWNKLPEDDHPGRFAFVLRLLYSCPLLYERIPGFQWVTDHLKWATEARKVNPEFDRTLWEVEKKLYGMRHKGRPESKVRDYLRYLKVRARMNVAIPKDGGLIIRKEKKSKAVGWVAETEMGKDGGDVRPIWRSLAKVRQEDLKIAKVLMAAGYRPTSPTRNPQGATPQGPEDESKESGKDSLAAKGKVQKRTRAKR